MPRLFVVFVFSLPLFQTIYILREIFIDGEKWQYGTIGFYVVDILLWIVLGMWAYSASKKKLRFCREDMTSHTPTKDRNKKQGHRVLLAFFITWMSVSIFWAQDQLLAFFWLYTFVLAIALFFLVVNLGNKKKVIIALLFAGVLQSALGLYQFSLQHIESATLFGISQQRVETPGTSVIKSQDDRILRAYGTFPHPNILGGFLAVVLILSGSLFRCTFDHGAKSVREKLFWKQFFLTVAFVVTFLGFAVTFSRTAWIAYSLGLALFLFYNFFVSKSILGRLRGDDRRYIVWYSASIFFGVVLSLVLFSSVICARFDTKNIKTERTLVDREILMEEAIDIAGDNILLGVGVGNYTTAIQERFPNKPIWVVQPVHNIFMLILVELGIVGLMLFVLSVGAAVRFALGEGRDTVHLYIIALGALLFIGLFDHWLWTSHFGILFFSLILGLVASAVRK